MELFNTDGSSKRTACLIFDFDGTLVKGTMFDVLFYELNIDKDHFWKRVQRSVNHGVGMERAYLSTITHDIATSRMDWKQGLYEKLVEGLSYFQGVPIMLYELKKHLKCLGVELRVYCITSGLKEIVESSHVGNVLEKCWGSNLSVNDCGFVDRVESVVTGADKALIVRELAHVYQNAKDTEDHNILYVGDGLTDVHAIKEILNMGGCGLLVYNSADWDTKARAIEARNLIGSAVDIYNADYRPTSELYNSIRNHFVH